MTPESESRKYARKVGCFLFPVWGPIYSVAALAGMLFEVLRRGFTEGYVRMGEFMSAIHYWERGGGQ